LNNRPPMDPLDQIRLQGYKDGKERAKMIKEADEKRRKDGLPDPAVQGKPFFIYGRKGMGKLGPISQTYMEGFMEGLLSESDQSGLSQNPQNHSS
jgi:hypothetical protein